MNSPESTSDFWETFGSLVLQVLTICIAGLLLFIFPIVLILSTPIFLYRYFVQITARWLEPSLEEMVAARGVIFATDSLYVKPRNTLITRITFEGTLDLDFMRARSSKRLVNSRLQNGELKYPELKQYLTQWMGFHFWKKDHNFDINNHVNLYKKEEDIVYSDAEVNSLITDLLQKPWVEGRPLWEIVLVHNCKLKGIESKGSDHLLPQTVAFIRVHHTLADGYAVFSLIYDGILDMKTLNAEPKYHTRPKLAQTLYGLIFPFRCAYELAENFITPFIPWITLPFSTPATKQTGQFHLEISPKIPLQNLKEIIRHFSVSFSSVLLAASAGAMRDIMIQKGIAIPIKYQFFLPMPLPGHPGTLTNYFGFGIAEVPVREADPGKRVQFCSKEFNKLKGSAFAAFSKFYIQGVGSYLPFISRFLTKHSSALTTLTNFAGGLVPPVLEGHRLLDTIFIEGPVGDAALALCALSFVDGFRISILADSSVMNKEDVEELTILVHKHIQLLHDKIDR